MSSLKSRIMASLEYRPEARPSSIFGNMRLLIDIGDPQVELATIFLAWYKKRLAFRVGEIKSCLTAVATPEEKGKGEVATTDESKTQAVVWGRNSAFLSDMNTLLESHSELFGEDKGDRDNDDEKTMQTV